MFGMGRRERAAYERLIVALADEIEWLRLHYGTPMPVAQHPSYDVRQLIADQPPGAERLGPTTLDKHKLWMDEDEETLQWQHQRGIIDTPQAANALAQLDALGLSIDDY